MKRALLSLACALPFALPAHAEDAPPRCTYVEVGTMPLRYAGTGLAPAVDGSIDGSPATLLVDTGDYETQLTMNAVAKRDLLLSMTGQYVEGIGGTSRLYRARVSDFAIGPVKSTRQRIYLPVIYEANLTPAFDAIVGAPFLLQADMEFDLRAKQMKFYRPKDCDRSVALNIWKEETVVLPFERSYSSSPNPHFTVTVNGKEMDALIDTGAHNSFLSLSAAKRLGIDVKGPNVTRLGDSVGIGSERAPNWRTPLDTMQIGGETIRGGELGIVESQGQLEGELYLGQDFLRAHRVLFAMSQRKLYIAYLGGDVFSRRTGLEPWMQQEADGGNADAQFALAAMYNNGHGVARDPKLGQAWLEKAAANGQPNANLVVGRQQMLHGQLEAAVPKLRAGLDQLPAERVGALWLYNARVRQGQAELAKTELAASVKKQHNDDWPAPIADFYLGKLDESGLLEQAGKDRKAAQARTCQATSHMAEWHGARGEKDQEQTLLASLRAHCGTPRPAAPAAAAQAPAPAPAAGMP